MNMGAPLRIGMQAAPFHADVAHAPEGAEAFWLEALDGLRIRIVLWRGGTRGTAFVFPGRTEYAEKYGLVAGHLLARGFSVVVIDWRGQGLSTRPAGAPMMGHVRSFPDYQNDVAVALAAAEALALPAPKLLVAHSMGGCIALRTLLETRIFRAAVMSAPMWGLQVRTALREIKAKALRRARQFGVRATVPAGSSSDATEVSRVFAGNALTSDPAAFDRAMAQVATHPELGLGPPSAGWTRAAFAEMGRLALKASPATPMLVFAGSEEQVVSLRAIRRRCARTPQARLVECPEGRHEIFMEHEGIQRLVWGEVDGFLAQSDAARGEDGSDETASD